MPERGDVLTLVAGRWYAWQMLPGYVDTGAFMPYVSPIYIEAVKPQKTGSGVLALAFINAAYAEGARYFELTVRVLKRAPAYMIVELTGDEQRAAIMGEISFEWLRQFCSDRWKCQSRESGASYGADVQTYLTRKLLSRGK